MIDPVAEGRGLKYALYGFLVAAAVVALLALPPGAPLRAPDGTFAAHGQPDLHHHA